MLPYAPTQTTSYTASDHPHVNFHEPVSRSALFKTPAHKAVYESLGEVYAIICTTQTVETAYTRDYITDKEKYTATILRLVSQYKVLLSGLHKQDGDHGRVVHEILPRLSSDGSDFLSVFCLQFGLECPLAIDRLSQGVPATIEQMGSKIEDKVDIPKVDGLITPATDISSGSGARLVAEATGNFITLMDALKLDYNSKSQLHPLLSNLVISLNELISKETEAPVEFASKPKLVSWLIKLNGLSETETLTHAECDEFLEHVDMAYHGFYNSL